MEHAMESELQKAGPSEFDQKIIEDFFREHCRSSNSRLGRLDVDCWSVTRRLVAFLSEIDDRESSEPPRRVRWVIQKPLSVLREPKRYHPIKRHIAQIFRKRLLAEDHHVSRKDKSRQMRQRITNATTTVFESSTISHWVIEWKGYIVDATVMQFIELDRVLDIDGLNELRKRCYNDDQSMTFKSCSDIHPPWVYNLVSRGGSYSEYALGVATKPYFFGSENEHPIRCYAEVVNQHLTSS
nr:uncharacterized protein LOC129278531 [Lytechinus pictus]